MAFVNQRGFKVDEVEWKKYNDLFVQANGGKGSLGSGNWTIDKERGIILVCLHTVRKDMYEGDFGLSKWVFYWHGEWMFFMQQESLGGKVSDSCWQKTRKIKNIIIPDAVKPVLQNMLQDLKEAFQTYRIAGYLDTDSYNFELKLDCSEVFNRAN